MGAPKKNLAARTMARMLPAAIPVRGSVCVCACMRGSMRVRTWGFAHSGRIGTESARADEERLLRSDSGRFPFFFLRLEFDGRNTLGGK